MKAGRRYCRRSAAADAGSQHVQRRAVGPVPIFNQQNQRPAVDCQLVAALGLWIRPIAIVAGRLRVPYVFGLVVAGSVYNNPDLVYVLVVPAF
jgi:hypothetical protein